MKVNFGYGLDTVWNDLGKEPGVGVGVGVSLWCWKEKFKPIGNVSSVRPMVTTRLLHFHVDIDTVLSFPTDFLEHLNNRLRRCVGLWQVKHRDLKPGDNHSLS